MKTLFVLNDPAYGTERSYNGLRLAHALTKGDGEEVRVFLLGIHDGQLVEGARRSGLEELTDWTIWADKVISF